MNFRRPKSSIPQRRRPSAPRPRTGVGMRRKHPQTIHQRSIMGEAADPTTVLQQFRDTQQRQIRSALAKEVEAPLKMNSKRVQDPHMAKYIPDISLDDPNIVRLSTAADFNLDFELELNLQKALTDKQQGKDSMLGRQHARKLDGIIEQMVNVKRREFALERHHLAQVKAKVEALKKQQKTFPQLSYDQSTQISDQQPTLDPSSYLSSQQLNNESIPSSSSSSQQITHPAILSPISSQSKISPSQSLYEQRLQEAQNHNDSQFQLELLRSANITSLPPSNIQHLNEASQADNTHHSDSDMSGFADFILDGPGVDSPSSHPDTKPQITHKESQPQPEPPTHSHTIESPDTILPPIERPLPVPLESDPLLENYFGYSDLLQELSQLTTQMSMPTSIIKRVEARQDPNHVKKTTDLIQDMLNDLPAKYRPHLNEALIKQRLADNLAEYKYKQVSIQISPVGEVQLGALAPEEREKYKESANASNAFFRQMRTYDNAQLSELNVNQAALTESGRNDRFDRFDDTPEIIALKRRMFASDNARRLKRRFEEDAVISQRDLEDIDQAIYRVMGTEVPEIADLLKKQRAEEAVERQRIESAALLAKEQKEREDDENEYSNTKKTTPTTPSLAYDSSGRVQKKEESKPYYLREFAQRDEEQKKLKQRQIRDVLQASDDETDRRLNDPQVPFYQNSDADVDPDLAAAGQLPNNFGDQRSPSDTPDQHASHKRRYNVNSTMSPDDIFPQGRVDPEIGESTLTDMKDGLFRYYQTEAPDMSKSSYQLGQTWNLDQINAAEDGGKYVNPEILDNVVPKDHFNFEGDQEGDALLKSSKQIKEDAKLNEQLKRRQEAQKLKAGQSAPDSAASKAQIKAMLGEEDQEFYNAETGQLYTSRPAHPNSASSMHNSADNIENLHDVDEVGAAWMNNMFDRGKDRGGVGFGSESSTVVDEEPEKLEPLPRFHVKQGIKTGDSLQMHPMDYINKFMLRIHPDLFVAEKYRVIDDINTKMLNPFVKEGRDIMGNTLSSSAVLIAKQNEYDNGEFEHPECVRYYSCSGAFLQKHTNTVLSQLNSLLEHYKRLTSLTNEELDDPFAPHLANAPTKQSFVFFIRGSSKSKIAKPKNLTLKQSIWDEENDVELESDDTKSTTGDDDGKDPEPIVQEENLSADNDDNDDNSPHIRALRVKYSPPNRTTMKSSDMREVTNAYILSMERTLVEILSALGNAEIPEEILQRWTTEISHTYRSKLWSKKNKTKTNLLDGMYNVTLDDLSAPTTQQVTDVWAGSSLAYLHMFPYATKQTEASFRDRTHPCHHLFNAMLLGGNIQFTNALTPKQRIYALKGLHRLIEGSYQHFDCFRWWTRRYTQQDFHEQEQIKNYIRDGNRERRENGQTIDEEAEEAMLKEFISPAFDDEKQHVWPNATKGEGFNLHLAITVGAPDQVPCAYLTSRRHILTSTHATQTGRLNVLQSIIKQHQVNHGLVDDDLHAAALDLDNDQEEFNDEEEILARIEQDSGKTNSNNDPNTARIDAMKNSYLQQLASGVYGLDNARLLRQQQRKESSNPESSPIDHAKSFLHENFSTTSVNSESEDPMKEIFELHPPTSMGDVCLQVVIPFEMQASDFQKLLLSHAYILYDEWKGAFTDFLVEFHAQVQLHNEDPNAASKQAPISLDECIAFLHAHRQNTPNMRSRRDIIMAHIAKSQPKLAALINFYQTMSQRKYKRVFETKAGDVIDANDVGADVQNGHKSEQEQRQRQHLHQQQQQQVAPNRAERRKHKKKLYEETLEESQSLAQKFRRNVLQEKLAKTEKTHQNVHKSIDEALNRVQNRYKRVGQLHEEVLRHRNPSASMDEELKHLLPKSLPTFNRHQGSQGSELSHSVLGSVFKKSDKHREHFVTGSVHRESRKRSDEVYYFDHNAKY